MCLLTGITKRTHRSANVSYKNTSVSCKNTSVSDEHITCDVLFKGSFCSIDQKCRPDAGIWNLYVERRVPESRVRIASVI